MISTITLKKALETLPDAIEPALSKKNQANMPVSTDFLTPSGAKSYTHFRKHPIQTPQPNRNPPVSADKNLVVGASKFCKPSMGKLRRSSDHLAGSEVGSIVPKKKIGPNEPITIEVNKR